MNNPKKIYIGDWPNELNDGWDYATKPISENDTEYIRADLIEQTRIQIIYGLEDVPEPLESGDLSRIENMIEFWFEKLQKNELTI